MHVFVFIVVKGSANPDSAAKSTSANPEAAQKTPEKGNCCKVFVVVFS